MRPLIFALALFSTPVLAQPFAPTTMRVTGTIEAADANSITVRALEGGGTNKVFLTPDAKVFGVSTTTLAEVKPGAFIGVGATPNADGSQRAIRVTVFAESQRGLGEGFRPWDRAPHGTMTNATVAETVKGVDGQVLTVKYKGGDKRIVVPPDARILAYSVGDRSELKVGAHVAILRAKRKLDGSWEADRVNVGRGSVIPD
ncbi:MAG TPA: hypothetical protein VGV41_21955 [Pseudolabrys sp.]|uniref:hypothetical protein n=1 Tax=Pseudolabrys sp. TaxID=1960880 RepID=UPI002DDCE08C|nr:hypothetical protein [Pseudolabrys sp.]HEV2631297.1 hypothetical protein [Pseudolabrys sp.]